jgi:hypothetical protein
MPLCTHVRVQSLLRELLHLSIQLVKLKYRNIGSRKRVFSQRRLRLLTTTTTHPTRQSFHFQYFVPVECRRLARVLRTGNAAPALCVPKNSAVATITVSRVLLLECKRSQLLFITGSPRCLDGSNPLGTCLNGLCPTNYQCTTGNLCCAANSTIVKELHITTLFTCSLHERCLARHMH